MFEANCSKQMGQHKNKIFHQMFLCLHEGLERFVCRMRIVIVLLEYKVEGDRTDTGAVPEMELKQIVQNFVLNAMCY